jgi:hypothetical protein
MPNGRQCNQQPQTPKHRSDNDRSRYEFSTLFWLGPSMWQGCFSVASIIWMSSSEG